MSLVTSLLTLLNFSQTILRNIYLTNNIKFSIQDEGLHLRYSFPIRLLLSRWSSTEKNGFGRTSKVPHASTNTSSLFSYEVREDVTALFWLSWNKKINIRKSALNFKECRAVAVSSNDPVHFMLMAGRAGSYEHSLPDMCGRGQDGILKKATQHTHRQIDVNS